MVAVVTCGAVDFSDAVVSTLAGGLSGTNAAFADGVGSQVGFDQLFFSSIDASGNIHYPDRGNQRIRKVTPAGGIIKSDSF